MSTLETRIHLPPGPVSPEAQDSLIRLWFGQEPIFKPVKYGRNDGDTSIEGDMRAVLRDFWAQRGRLTVTGKPSGHFLTVFPNRGDESTWTGSATWSVPLKSADDRWKKSHVLKVATAMRVLGAPLAYAGTSKDLEAKCWRWLDDPTGGQRKVPTVVSPADGIPGMFWRLFVDARMAAGLDRKAFEPGVATDVEGILVFSPYPDPALAGSEAALVAETALIEKLGADLFFDHAKGSPPTRRPGLRVPAG